MADKFTDELGGVCDVLADDIGDLQKRVRGLEGKATPSNPTPKIPTNDNTGGGVGLPASPPLPFYPDEIWDKNWQCKPVTAHVVTDLLTHKENLSHYLACL